MKGDNKRIIIFDDDEDILSICKYILEETGWEVHTFTDCSHIIDRVSSLMPDVILMDNWIPDEGGLSATKLIKDTENIKAIPVIYFSANSEIETLAKSAGAEAYLAKPFDLEELESIINRVV